MKKISTDMVLLIVLLLFSNTLAINSYSSEEKLTTLSSWDSYGTIVMSGDKIIVGDTVGYDPSDIDQDLNPFNTLNCGSFDCEQGVDYELLISRNTYAPPMSISWYGCITNTSYGYHELGLAYTNPDFTGEAGKGVPTGDRFALFGMNWQTTGLITQAEYKSEIVSGTSSDKNCGDYNITWDGSIIDFYFNNNKVRTEDFVYTEGNKIVAFARNFDNFFEISSFTVSHSASAVTNSNCRTTFKNGILHIPCFDIYNPLDESEVLFQLEVDLSYKQGSVPISFEVIDAKVVE